MKAPTLKDIAKLLNISPGTVSKALRGKPDVGENLRLAVKEAAEKINYQPNRAALSLRKAKTNTIGVVVPNLSYHFFSLALQGIEAVADANGFTVIASQSQEKYEKEINCISNMLRSGVDGIIVSLAQHTINLNHLKTALRYGVPLVQLDRITNELPNTSRVMVDNTAGAFGAVEHLIRQGCRRIGYVGGPRELDISNRRREGYRLALSKFNLPYDEKLLISCEFNHEKTIRQVLELLNSSDPPDALFACSDRLAMSAMVAAKQKGLSIPNQLAIVGFNNEPVSSLLYPALSSVYQPTFEMGKAAASLLIEEIKQGEQFTPKTKVFKTKLFKRASSNIIS